MRKNQGFAAVLPLLLLALGLGASVLLVGQRTSWFNRAAGIPTTPPFPPENILCQPAASWGSAGQGNAQFGSPQGIAADRGGNIYVADTGNRRIQKFDNGGSLITSWNTHGTPQYPSKPVRITPNKLGQGYIYVSDNGFNTIDTYTESGTYLGGSAITGVGQPYGIVQDYIATSGARLYIIDRAFHQVFVSNSLRWGSQGSGNGQFSYPMGIAVDPLHNVLVADTHNNRVQKFTPIGQLLLTIDNQSSIYGPLKSPQGVASDKFGNIYVADTANNRVLIFSKTGAYLHEISAFNNSHLNQPSDLIVDQYMNLFVLETANSRVSKYSCAYTPPPTITHKECRNLACAVVDGAGADTCQQNTDCLPVISHTECKDNTCVRVTGPGKDACKDNTDCQPVPTSHTECQNKACVKVAGPGKNACTTNTDCVPQLSCRMLVYNASDTTKPPYKYGQALSGGATLLPYRYYLYGLEVKNLSSDKTLGGLGVTITEKSGSKETLNIINADQNCTVDKTSKTVKCSVPNLIGPGGSVLVPAGHVVQIQPPDPQNPKVTTVYNLTSNLGPASCAAAYKVGPVPGTTNPPPPR